ncbi:MAG TPA: hypothetical protein VMG74_06565 [Gaiellaceae bacterium]|nr:hypothetical protein [Gaiellaceae bacterium]
MRALLIGAATLMLAACGGSGSSGASDEGLYGTVRLSPATPVCKIGTSCSRPIGGFTIVFLQNGRRIAIATTDKHGRYRVRLSSGRYAVQPLRGVTLRKAGLRPRRVNVPSGRTARADFTYDTGIR